MRLIDADVLQKKFEGLKEKDGHATGRNAYDLCAMLTEDAPTVEAVVLPCKEFFGKMGDYIYVIDDVGILELLLCAVGFDAIGTDSIISVYGKPHEEDCETFTHRFADVGKTVFLSREEAEAELAERKMNDAEQ